MDANTSYLDAELNRQEREDRRAEEIEIRAIDIFTYSFEMLNKANLTGDSFRKRDGYNMWSLIDDIPLEEFQPLADAIVIKDYTIIGERFFNMVVKQLQANAMHDAEESME